MEQPAEFNELLEKFIRGIKMDINVS